MSAVRMRRRSGGASLAFALAGALTVGLPAQPALAQPRQIDLTVDRLVQLTMDNSYEIQLLRMGVEQTRLRLRAERAGLKSRIRMDVTAPTFESVSETQYNSTLGRNEIVRENSRRWEGQFSIQQPVILFGYPTNGFLSLNNRVYRYSQVDPDGDSDLTWYNRYFVQYTQPLFQANELKNEIESAELEVEDSEMEFEGDMMEIVGDAYETHRDLFENVYGQKITSDYVANLQLALQAAQAAVAANPARSIDLDQVRVELTNAEQRLGSSQSGLRRDLARLKSELNLTEDVEIRIQPTIEFRPVQVDVETAIGYARTLAPRLRQLDIQRREQEINLDETKGNGGFQVDLEFTYGREMRDPVLSHLWEEPTNAYTVDVNASIPIWDWGQRRDRIAATEINVRRNRLQIEQAEKQLRTQVENEIGNLQELQARVITLRDNLALAADISRQSLDRYRQGQITALDMLTGMRRESDTANSYLQAYADWRESLQSIQQATYWDFETNQRVSQRFSISTAAEGTPQ